MQKDIEEKTVAFESIQVLKFGQVVDLDLIERLSSTKHLEELEKRLEAAEKEAAGALEEWKVKIEQVRGEISRATKVNSVLLDESVKMGYSRMRGGEIGQIYLYRRNLLRGSYRVSETFPTPLKTTV